MDADQGKLSAAQYQQLIERTSDVITVVDEEGVIIYQSPGSAEMKGWTPEELIGENIMDYVHPDDRNRVAEEFGMLTLKSGIKKEIEFRFKHKDGDWVWLSVTGTAPEGDVIDGYITTSRDVTDRKRRERNLELLNQIVRHDIRNKLQIILGYGESLRDHVDGQQADHLDQLLTSAQEAVEITQTARDVAEVLLRSEADLTAINLETVLTEEVNDIQSYHSRAVVTIDGGIPDVDVVADDLLPAVFRNLLTNAIEHNDKDVPEVTVSATRTDDTVTVRVMDNGPGIPDDSKERIFEEGETGLDNDGTGIGLYLVDTLVQGYGGSVEVTDNQPEGAVFTVSLPVATDGT